MVERAAPRDGGGEQLDGGGVVALRVRELGGHLGHHADDGPVAAGHRELRGRPQQHPGLRRVARRELHLRAQHGEVGLALGHAEVGRVGGEGGVDDGEVGAGRAEIARHALDLRLRRGEAAVRGAVARPRARAGRGRRA